MGRCLWETMFQFIFISKLVFSIGWPVCGHCAACSLLPNKVCSFPNRHTCLSSYHEEPRTSISSYSHIALFSERRKQLSFVVHAGSWLSGECKYCHSERPSNGKPFRDPSDSPQWHISHRFTTTGVKVPKRNLRAKVLHTSCAFPSS